MLYSFYLIVYLICISYFIYSYYIYLYLILLFPFLYVCRLYIGFLLSLILCYFLFLCLFLGIYDNIKDSMIFIFMCCMGSLALCDNYYHWLMIIFFYFFMCCLGLWVYNPCDMGIIYIIELGFIYSISFLFVFFGMSVRDSFIILEV